MSTHSIRLVALALCLAGSLAISPAWFPSLTARPDARQGNSGKNKPTTDPAGEATFRCPAGSDCAGTDAIVGDGATYDASSNARVVLNSNGEMRLELSDPSRQLTADLSQGDDVAPCSMSGPVCRYWSAWVPGGANILVLPGKPTVDGVLGVLLQTNVVDAAGNELSGGLLAMPEGGTSNSRFSVSFQDPDGRDMHWVVRYYPELYAGSDYVAVTRNDACTWTLEAPADARGACWFTTTSCGARVAIAWITASS